MVPPKLDLPPPGSVAAEAKAPNWPKDPDEQRRNAAIAARKKANKDPMEASRILTPSELAQAKGKKLAERPPVRPRSWNKSTTLYTGQWKDRRASSIMLKLWVIKSIGR